MAITKATQFNKKQVRMAEFAKALAHPARIAILEILAESDMCICGDITEQLPLAQSTVSQHLKALKSAGIITGNIDGVKTCYCLDNDSIDELRSMMGSLLNKLGESSSYC